MTSPAYFITTAIAYANGAPHIGHAYEMVATDAIARFKRLDGYDVHFLTGMDEHGSKVAKTAEARGVDVLDFTSEIAEIFKDLAGQLNLSNDDFIRTTEPRHHEASRAIWQAMEANGDIYLDKYAGWYSVRDERFFVEDETEERDGQRYAIETGTEVEWMEEESYFFRLSAYQDKLLALYEADPGFISPSERRNEILSFVKGGLQDLSISRTSFDWGVPVPNAPDHVMYVWVDALTNYMTSIGYPDTQSESFQKFWPADLHVIGKDIIRFHAIFWPAFLMSAKLPVPKRVFGHGFLTADGKKMSKSLGNVIDPFELIEEFGADPVRYYFLREVSFGSDGDYSREKFINRNNADLANDLGNLAQRSLSMIAKNCDQQVPTPGELTSEDEALLAASGEAIEKARVHMESQAVHEAAAAIWAVVGDANKYFADQAPWGLKKTDPQRMQTVLYVTAETIRRLAIATAAFVPTGSSKLLDILNAPADERLLAHCTQEFALKPGTKLPKPEPVFTRFEKSEAN